MKKIMALVMALLCILMLLAGCGGGNSGADAPAEGVNPPVAGGTENPIQTPTPPAQTILSAEVIVPDGYANLELLDVMTLKSILDNGEWYESIGGCDNDCQIVIWETEAANPENYTAIYTLTYHSECGTFENGYDALGLACDKETMQQINLLLGKYVTLGNQFTGMETPIF